jgi:hypothetical protein
MSTQLLLLGFAAVSAVIVAALIALDRSAHPLPHHLAAPPRTAAPPPPDETVEADAGPDPAAPPADEAVAGAEPVPWQPGADPFLAGETGLEPDDAVVTGRHWVNRSADASGLAVYGAANLARLRRGLAPQRTDPRTNASQAMVVTVDRERRRVAAAWPDAALDPFAPGSERSS